MTIKYHHQVMANFCMVLLLYPPYVANALNEICESNKNCNEDIEICSTKEKQCKCRPGAKIFANQCFGVSEYGGTCQWDIECSNSGDVNLKCISSLCKCVSGWTYKENLRKCTKHTDNIVHPIFRVNKRAPQSTDRMSIELDEKYKHIKDVR